MAALRKQCSALLGRLKKEEKSAEPESGQREKWTRAADFVLSSIGYAVGLGNVWRFPYLCYKNGGGAFLVPYALMLVMAGLPIFFMEVAWGQYAAVGPITIMRIAPLFKGIGYSMAITSGLKSMYYNMVMAYIIYYFVHSFTTKLPWTDCDNEWNTIACTKYVKDFMNCTNRTVEGKVTEVCSDWRNLTTGPKTPADEYFHNHVLEITDGIGNLGIIRWPLVLCYFGSWAVIVLCMVKSIKSVGRVVWFTATFPYVVLTILLVRGATLPGAMEGIRFYIIPDFSRIGDAQVWGDAAVQIFYSLGVAYGSLVTMSSYNKFNQNCYRDAMIIASVNCLTSVYAGFAIFSVLGFMAYSLGVDVADATASGAGLVFVAYPEGISRMPAAPVWGVIFFLMLFILGLDSMFTMIETITTAVTDEFPDVFRKRKFLLTLGVVCVFFLIGLPMCTQGGIYLLTLMDGHSAGFPLLFISLIEILVLMQVYGYDRFVKDIESMLGFRPNIYWRITWTLLAPMALIFIIIFKFTNLKPLGYGDYELPSWAIGISWALVAFDLAFIPFFMIKELVKQYRIHGRRPLGYLVNRACIPDMRWGPASNTFVVNNNKYTQTGEETDDICEINLDMADDTNVPQLKCNLKFEIKD